MAAALLSWPVALHAKKTVCTITINSADERDVMRRWLPGDDYEVVELVQRGRPDWLDAACQSKLSCDALVISGHFDGGVEFYTDRFDRNESLPVDDLERASCSNVCPALFGSLKEVYLFGCNTLRDEAGTAAVEEVERTLRRLGLSAAEAARIATRAGERTALSNRDRMRVLFRDVPVIYGFTSKAPLGQAAGPVLERHLQTDATRDVATGRVNHDLVKRFAAVSMATASGIGSGEPLAAQRSDVCGFVKAQPKAGRVAFVRELLRRDIAEVRMRLDALERFVASPPLANALAPIAGDEVSRNRFLDYARATDDALTRARMIGVAHGLGWLDDGQRHAELGRLIADRVAIAAQTADVDLACRLNGDGRLDAHRPAVTTSSMRTADAAVLACLGDAASRRRVLDAVASGRDEDLAAAETLLLHRPLDGREEARQLVRRAARVAAPDGQARAVRLLARPAVLDAETMEAIVALFPATKSLAVQRAVAEVLVRTQGAPVDAGRWARLLRQHRLPSADGRDVIDVLIRRLEAS